MTRQETFTTVANHLLDQGVRSEDSKGCSYRSGDLRCAIGVLIPDELYSSEIEGLSVVNPKVSRILQELGHSIFICAALQSIHDSISPDGWRLELAKLAQEEGFIFQSKEV